MYQCTWCEQAYLIINPCLLSTSSWMLIDWYASVVIRYILPSAVLLHRIVCFQKFCNLLPYKCQGYTDSSYVGGLHNEWKIFHHEYFGKWDQPPYGNCSCNSLCYGANIVISHSNHFHYVFCFKTTCIYFYILPNNCVGALATSQTFFMPLFTVKTYQLHCHCKIHNFTCRKKIIVF